MLPFSQLGHIHMALRTPARQQEQQQQQWQSLRDHNRDQVSSCMTTKAAADNAATKIPLRGFDDLVCDDNSSSSSSRTMDATIKTRRQGVNKLMNDKNSNSSSSSNGNHNRDVIVCKEEAPAWQQQQHRQPLLKKLA
jgi:hypothetical protein